MAAASRLLVITTELLYNVPDQYTKKWKNKGVLVTFSTDTPNTGDREIDLPGQQDLKLFGKAIGMMNEGRKALWTDMCCLPGNL